MRRLAAFFVVLVALLVPRLARAQQPSQDAMTEIARQRYKEGVALFEAGKFEEARAAFFQSYALKAHPVTLFNLGLSEVRSTHPVAGGNHLLQFLREAPDAKAEDRATAQQAIEDAKRRAAQVIIMVDAAGADVSVDGTLIGKAPLADPVFVEPGSRTILATLGTQNGMARVDAKRGAAVTATVVIGVNKPNPEVPPTGTVPPPPTAAPTGTTAPPPDGQLPGTPDDERESFFHWYGRKPLAWVGTGLTVVGLGMGIGFTVAAANSASRTDEIAEEITFQANERNIPSKGICSRNVDGFTTACTALADSKSANETNLVVAGISWGVFGVGLIGTVTYILVDYLPSKASDQTGLTIVPMPVLTPDYQGLSVGGRF